VIRVKHLITDEERSALDRVRKLVGLRQQDLAKRMGGGIEQNWISQTLSGKRKVRKIDDVERLAKTLLGLFETKRLGLDLDPDFAETLAVILRRMAYLSSPGKMPVTRLITPPGRPVPRNAVNYVERKADTRLNRLLQQGDFSIRVMGPAQSGRTSLLLKLTDEAKRQNFITHYLSVKDVEGDVGFEVGAENERDAFLQWLKQRLANHWRLRYTIEDQEMDFASWIAEQLQPDQSRNYLLVIDDLSELEISVAHNLLQQFRTAMNETHTLSVALGLPDIGRIAIRSSLFVVERIELDWFEKEQLEQLSEALGKAELLKKKVSNDVNYLDLLFERYRGQPLLSHFAIANITKIASKADFLRQCDEWEGDSVFFRAHRKLIEKCFHDTLKVLRSVSRENLSDGRSLLGELKKHSEIVDSLELAKNIVRNRANTANFEFSSHWYQMIADEVVKEFNTSEVGAEEVA
jgi:transcriptional regulator with XRE-family HTH domain